MEPTTTTTTTPTPTIDDGLIDDVENTETEELPEVLAQNVADDDDDDTTDTQQHSHACRRGRNGRRHRNGFGAPLPVINAYTCT